MTIRVFSKKNCGICEAAKKKLNIMGFDFTSHDLEEVISLHPGWREDGSIEVMAGYAKLNNAVPTIQIGSEFHDYPSAMRTLKQVGGPTQ